MCYRKWQCITKGSNSGKPCGCTFGLTTCLGLLYMWHALGAFVAFKAEERHKTLKTEIRFRSFKGGAGKIKGGVRGRRGRLVRQVFVKGWREVVKNDNLDCGLLKRGWDVWVRAWTQQPHVKEHKTYWKANAP